MSTPSDPIVPGADAAGDDRRLHPLSWLFVLLQQLRSFAVPLVVLVATGRGGPALGLPLVGVAGLVVVSLIQYVSYRYRAGVDGFVITSGVLQRTRRDIPYERIHTVNLHQSLLHRIFDVTEVRLESAGGKEAEAVMRVLSMADARALEQLVRERGAARRDEVTETAAATPDPADTRLLALGTMEVIRLGLISNRGMVVVAAVAGASWQFADDVGVARDDVPGLARDWFRLVRDVASTYTHDAMAMAIVAILILVPALILVRALSVLLALLQYHGFTLSETGRQLRVERGLLSRVRNQVPKRRIQVWRIDETLLHRWFGRQALRVDSAAGSGDDEHAVRYLAPVATPVTVNGIVGHLRTDDVWPPAAWQSIHPRAWRRYFIAPAVMTIIATAILTWVEGPVGLLTIVVVPLLWMRARALARFAGYAVTDRTIAVRGGWWHRSWGLAEIRKLQTLRVTASPFDRRLGMATLWLDTAGASAGDGVLRIPYMPTAEAKRLYAELTQRMTAATTTS